MHTGPAIESLDRFRGCLLGGAVGDALGGPVEFDDLATIRSTYGDRIDLADLPTAEFTDDTQMTLFTAEGLIRANLRGREKGITSWTDATYRAYLRWLRTQGLPSPQTAGRFGGDDGPDGWLVGQPVLHRQAAPGTTCLSALASGRMGTRTQRINTSKGCGGVMRAAPVGLFSRDPAWAFTVGCDIAAITHSHPSGWLPAGALAAMVSRLAAGDTMQAAVATARELLATEPEADETIRALDAAVALAAHGQLEPEQLEALGGGWVGEEALAIAVACALSAQSLPQQSLPRALSVAVLHSGDSDSTGAICGNLLGTARGVDAIPAAWIGMLDGAGVVDQIARDLWTEWCNPPAEGSEEFSRWWRRYPGA